MPPRGPRAPRRWRTVPDPVQQLAADRVEAHVGELAGERIRGGAITRAIPAGLDRPGPCDGGVQTLVESRLAALVPQDIAVDAKRLALVAVALGIARRLARIERQLADIGLEAAGDAGSRDLAGGRGGGRRSAGGREQTPEAEPEAGMRHQEASPAVGRGLCGASEDGESREGRIFGMARSSSPLRVLCTAPWCGEEGFPTPPRPSPPKGAERGASIETRQRRRAGARGGAFDRERAGTGGGGAGQGQRPEAVGMAVGS